MTKKSGWHFGKGMRDAAEIKQHAFPAQSKHINIKHRTWTPRFVLYGREISIRILKESICWGRLGTDTAANVWTQESGCNRKMENIARWA
jgi:hypothetical protein